MWPGGGGGLGGCGGRRRVSGGGGGTVGGEHNYHLLMCEQSLVSTNSPVWMSNSVNQGRDELSILCVDIGLLYPLGLNKNTCDIAQAAILS